MASSIGYTSILSVRAGQEITASWQWYEERQPGLGDRFVKNVVQRIEQIEQFPERYTCRYKTYRETIIEVFPFSIIYRVNKKKRLVQVVSIFHSSRNPVRKYRK